MHNWARWVVRNIPSGIGRASKIIALISLAGILAIFFLQNAEIITRKIIGKSIGGSLELSQFSLALIAFCGLAFTEMQKGHVKVEIVTRRLSSKMKEITNILSLVIADICIVFLAYLWWGYTIHSWQIREYAWTIIPVPLYPFKTIAFIGICAFFAQLSAEILVAVNRLLQNIEPRD